MLVRLIGGGMLVATNLGQMVQSLKVGNAATGVTLFSVLQAISRMLTGMLSDRALLHGWCATAACPPPGSACRGAPPPYKAPRG